MPHYRCPACGVTTHSVGGRFRANACPNCSAPLAPSDRIFIDSEQRHAIHCDLAAEPEAGGAARRVLASFLDDSDDAESEIAALLMTELINNSVEHSGAPERSIVCLDIAVTDDLIRVEVRDQGDGFVPFGRTSGSPVDSHWGLHLIDELATSWGVSVVPPTLAWFELDRRTPISEGQASHAA